MISNTKDIWRLESKWSDHDRFWTDHDRKLAEVSYDFFLNFTCVHKHSRQRSYIKLRKNMETSVEERMICISSDYSSENIQYLLLR